MIGLTKEQGLGSLESMGAALRNNPGLQQLLKQYLPSYKMGNTLGAEDQLGLVNKLKGQMGEGGYYVASQMANLFGMDEGTFRQMWTNLDELNQQYVVAQARLKDLGVNTEATDKAFVEFKRAMTDLDNIIFDLGTKWGAWIAEHFGTPVVKATSEAITAGVKAGGSTSHGIYESMTSLLESALGFEHGDASAVSGTTTASGGGRRMFGPTGSREKDVMLGLMGMGLTKNEAIGGLAVFQNESGLNPNNLNPHGGASGLMQWTGTRKSNFYKMFGHYPHEGTMDEAMQFIYAEGHGGEKQMTQLFNILESNKNLTAGQSANLWRNLGERPEAWAYTGVGATANELAESGKYNDIDFNNTV